MSVNFMPSFGPLDAAAGAAYSLLTHLTTALAPIGGGAAAALAVVLLTASVRLLVLPLAIRQAAAQARMKARMKARRDQTPQPEDLGGLLGGLLPALIQAPVFVVLWVTITRPTVDGQPNALLAADLFGVPLGAAGLHAGWPLLVLLAAIALVATVSARRMRRSDAPRWLAALPYLTLVPAATMPLAAGLYLLTTTAWSAAETAIIRRE